MWLLSHWLTAINEQDKRGQRESSVSSTSAISLAPNCLFTCVWLNVRVMRTLNRHQPLFKLQDTGGHASPFPAHLCTISLSPKKRIEEGSQARCSHGRHRRLSLPTSSLLAPAKTFEVFERQGNTFAFHWTCLWRPLKYIIAEQQRFPLPPLIIYLVKAHSLQLTHQAENEFGPLFLSPSLSLPPFISQSLSPSLSFSLCDSPPPIVQPSSYSCSVSECVWMNEARSQLLATSGCERFVEMVWLAAHWYDMVNYLMHAIMGNCIGIRWQRFCILGKIMNLVHHNKKACKRSGC